MLFMEPGAQQPSMSKKVRSEYHRQKEAGRCA